jgi:hypothetical protein
MPAKRASDPFGRVRTAGLALAGVEAATKYDGSPVLKAGGSFMAGAFRGSIATRFETCSPGRGGWRWRRAGGTAV